MEGTSQSITHPLVSGGNPPLPGTRTPLQRSLLHWYARRRRDLPWRRTGDPYSILVAEVMLQQTPVSRVIPKWCQFLEAFPTWAHLAGASPGDVIRVWSPLGYNLRAVRLHRLAREVVRRLSGHVPRTPDALRRLPGVGPYTAAAVACFAFGQDVPVLDTNVRRVLSRVVFGVRPPPRDALEAAAREQVPAGEAPAWSQALMDVGALLCTVRRPRCSPCPLRPHCVAAPLLQGAPRGLAEASVPYRAAQPPYRGSRRYYRGRIVEALRRQRPGAPLSLDALGAAAKGGYTRHDRPWLLDLLRQLERDGLVRLEQGSSPKPGSVQDTHIRVFLP